MPTSLSIHYNWWPYQYIQSHHMNININCSQVNLLRENMKDFGNLYHWRYIVCQNKCNILHARYMLNLNRLMNDNYYLKKYKLAQPNHLFNIVIQSSIIHNQSFRYITWLHPHNYYCKWNTKHMKSIERFHNLQTLCTLQQFHSMHMMCLTNNYHLSQSHKLFKLYKHPSTTYKQRKFQCSYCPKPNNQ